MVWFFDFLKTKPFFFSHLSSQTFSLYPFLYIIRSFTSENWDYYHVYEPKNSNFFHM